MNTSIIITFIRLLLILPFYLSNIFACNCSYEKNLIVRSSREYNYLGNVLEYDYFDVYSSTRSQKVRQEYDTITPSLVHTYGLKSGTLAKHHSYIIS